MAESKNLLTTFLTEAYDASRSDVRYAFITSSDSSVPPTPAQPPVQNAIKTSGVEVCADAVEHLQEKLSSSDVDPRYFVVLDEHSLQPEERGCIIGDVKGENYVRCRFSSSLLALEALRSGRKNFPDLWLDAALAGGVIPQSSSDGGRYQSFTDGEEAQRCIKTLKEREFEENDPQKDQPFAVFCTAEVSRSVLNELLTNSESPETTGLCILDTLEPNQQTRTTTAPIQENFTSPFIGKDFSWILHFVTDVLPSSSLDSQKFLVVDSFTLASSQPKRSVLHVDTKGSWKNSNARGIQRDCFAARDSFETCYLGLLEEVASMDELATEGAIQGGVYDF